MNKNRWLPYAALPILLFSSAVLMSGCDKKQDAAAGAAQEAPPQAVETITIKNQSIEIKRILPARTNAYLISEIRPQVTGTILKREFIEGSNVKAGQSLYQIDPATYQAALNNAKANLASAKADAQLKRLTLQRYQSLLTSKSISQQEYDTAKAETDKANAMVLVAQATLENAQINLNYTRVYSPISGRIGKSTVTEGALVTAGQGNTLATVQQLDPIYVDMTQAATDYLRLKTELEDGTLKQSGGKALVTLIMDNGQTYSQQGTLEFSDVTVDESTGSILLRAVFPNADNKLLPGMFVRAELIEGTLNNAILVPQTAVTRDARGQAHVKIMNAQNIVENRKIDVDRDIGNSWLVTAGLKKNDKVIISGLQKIRDGSKVVDQSTVQKHAPAQQ